ncbi:MAG: flagellar biosynthetic protein FliO [Treponema sp.]|jgi:flagellar protein FliO/FliZ|nr:flagellar biosynthetic protein FliO [Treponema sp.]
MAVLFIVISPSALFSQDLVAPSGANQEVVVPQDNASSVIDENQFFIGDPVAEDENQDPFGGSSFFLILRMILVLVLSAAAIYALVFFVKKISLPKKIQDPYLKVLSSASLGPNRSVHVISLGEKAWLVGSADNSVSLISEIDDKETIDAMLLDDSRNSANGNTGRFIDFRSIFSRLAGQPDDEQQTGNVPKSQSLQERRKRFKGF